MPSSDESHPNNLNYTNSNKYIQAGAVTVLRDRYGDQEVVRLDWDIPNAHIQDLHFLYRYLKSVKQEMDTGHPIVIDWIINTSRNESIAMGKDLETLIEIKFQFVPLCASLINHRGTH